MLTSICVLSSGFLKFTMPLQACLQGLHDHSLRQNIQNSCTLNHSKAIIQNVFSMIFFFFLHPSQYDSMEPLYHMFELLIISAVQYDQKQIWHSWKTCSCLFNRSRLYIKSLSFSPFLHFPYIKIHSVLDFNFIATLHFFYFWRKSCFLIRNTQETLPLLSVPVIFSCRITYTESLQISPECTKMLLQESLIAAKHIPCLLGDEASITARHMLVHSAAEGL